MNGSPVTFDTNGWFALLNSRDRLHRRAVTAYQAIVQSRSPFLVTDWVIAETGNGLARTPARQNFRHAVEILLDDPRTTLVVIDGSLMWGALERYDQRSDKSWGLVDCATMLVMEKHGSTKAFMSDVHFEQAGFTALLRDVKTRAR